MANQMNSSSLLRVILNEYTHITMKNTYTIITSLAIIAGLSLTAYAKPPKKGKKPRGVSPILKAFFDKDADDKLSDEEKEAAQAADKERRKTIKEKMLAQFDADKDGELSKDEKKERNKAGNAKNKEILEAILTEFDKDGDKKISAEERTTDILAWVEEKYPDAILRLAPPKAKKKKAPKKKTQK